MKTRTEAECRTCGRIIRAGEDMHIVLGGNAQCCSCYEGDEPCERREPRTVSCGCCDAGCICFMHQDGPGGKPPRLCAYHAEHGHPHVTILR